ncbi:MAG TPA: DUF4153 domain-containing protein, partial [Clostridia bacterium]|nr:DUF4153 domain-containing protein [Clostridia bacterium]
MRIRKFLLGIKKALIAVAKTIARFPLTMVVLTALTVLIIYRIEVPTHAQESVDKLLDRIVGTLALGIPVSLLAHMIRERYLKSVGILIQLGIYAATAVLLFLYMLFFLKELTMVSLLRLILLTAAAGLMFLTVPYLLSKPNFEVYIASLVAKAATSAFFTIVLATGITMVVLAVQELLYEDLSRNIYKYIWVIAGYMFLPVYFLHNYPQKDTTFEVADYNKVLKITFLYILLPVLSAYTLVLYIYFIKILVNWEWPKGIVSYLVTSYASVCIFSLFMVRPFIAENKWAKICSLYFTKLILPLLAMMFMSIGMRIADYGVTENRYFIIVIGIWSVFASLFYVFNKGRHNTVLPVSLAIVMLISVASPVNAFVISRYSQNRRFEEILERNNMIASGQIVANSQIPQKDKREITAILQYFNMHHSFDDVKYLPEEFGYDDFKKTFGFDWEYDHAEPQDSFYYWAEKERSITVTGYDVLFPVYLYDYNETDRYGNRATGDYGQIDVTINNDITLKIQKDGVEIYKYDLKEYVQALYDKHGTLPKSEKDLIADMVLADENDKARIR